MLLEVMMYFLVFLCIILLNFDQIHCKDQDTWFPYPPHQKDTNPVVEYGNLESLHDAKHGIQMGIASKYCDDGKTNLTLDWDGSPLDYTCYENRIRPDPSIYPIVVKDSIPKQFHALHICMSHPIRYNSEVIPTFGYHRPLWAKYGEYLYLPKQRWLHNLEHGAVVMLYHPCADQNEVKFLKRVVENCLYRHVITPYAFLPKNRPLSLITWGVQLLMSKVDENVVIKFIMNNALNAPENLYKDGQFDQHLLSHAKIVSDKADSNLCSNYLQTMK